MAPFSFHPSKQSGNIVVIQVDCECGRALKVKDAHAGKRVRCPECSQPLRIPEPVSDDDFLEDEDDDTDWGGDDDWDDEPVVRKKRQPSSSRSSSRSGGKRKSKSKKKKESGGSLWRRIFGVLAILMGILVTIGVVLSVLNGNIRAIRGGFFAFICFAAGVAWLRGETYGE